MSRWFRVDDGLVDDPKVQQLPDRLFRAVVNLWCITSQSGGKLPEISQVAFKLRASETKAKQIIGELRKAGLIDEDETGVRPHNWNGRQFKSDVSTERVKQFRKRSGNVSSTVSETPPETETDTEAERKRKTRASALVPSDDWPSDFREQFWSKYPNKVGKPTALKKLEITRKSGRVTWVELAAGLEEYIHKNDDRPWCNPVTWINQQRWADKPASVQKPRDAQQQRSDDALDQLRNFNRSRDEERGKTSGFLLENPGERPENFHSGDDRTAGELPRMGIVVHR